LPSSSPAVSSADKFEDVYSQLLTYEGLARYSKLSTRTLEYYVAARKIPHIKLGRNVRFRLADVERALKRYEIREVAL
jgi:excisionase family DNA binding protein